MSTQNIYYSSKALIDAERYEDALQGFMAVVDAADGKSEWAFKALKQAVKVKLLSRSTDNKSIIDSFRQLLDYSTAVTRNAAEKKVNSLLDFVSSQKDGNNELLEEFFTSTLNARADSKSDRLYFKTSVKLATLYLATGQHGKAEEVVERLLEDAEEGGQLLEVYALRIQLLGSQADRSKHALLQATYRKALSITSAIPHPRVLGVIHQVGGKMHMMSSNWSDAATDFFNSFRAFDEAGMGTERAHCLKYLVLANMMMESDVDPFDSQETRPYKTDPVVSAMTALVSAYQASDIAAFERAMKHEDIAGDSWIAPQLAQLRKKLCCKVIVREVAPYTRVKLDLLREFVGASGIDVEELLLELLLDGRIAGKINQCEQVLEIRHVSRKDAAYSSLRQWAGSLAM